MSHSKHRDLSNNGSFISYHEWQLKGFVARFAVVSSSQMMAISLYMVFTYSLNE